MIFIKNSHVCSPGYTLNVQMCYKVFREENPFYEAYGKCLQKEGLVASVHDQQTNAFLVDLFKRNSSESIKEFWIGLIREEDEWRWADGKPMGYTNWDAGMPEKNATDRFVVMDKENKWRTIGKEEKRAFVCEKLISTMQTQRNEASCSHCIL